MRKLFYLGIGLVVLLFTACFEEDTYIIPRSLNQIEIPYSMYENQTYFSISNQSIVATNNFADWDLGFESSKDGYHIILNYARYMYAGNTFKTDFSTIKSNTTAEMGFDHSSGNLDSTILKNWADFSDVENPIFNEFVYVIDRGKDETGQEFGFKKVVFEKLENDTFYVHFANLDGTEDYRCKIPKDTTVNFTLFSLEGEGQIITSEPNKKSWDICFTKYSTVIPDDYGVPTDYLVRGVFLNPYKNIEVALDTVNHFNDVVPEMIDDYLYSNNRDAIGYDWKVYKDNLYEIRDYNTYILKDVSSLNYKLRFTSFYNSEGEKGYPAFELSELQTF